LQQHSGQSHGVWTLLKTDGVVEGLYCKRPIQCLASSEILTPHPLTALRCVPPAFGAGGGHTRWGERGWGVISSGSEDARHCSALYICKYFVVGGSPTLGLCCKKSERDVRLFPGITRGPGDGLCLGGGGGAAEYRRRVSENPRQCRRCFFASGEKNI
jgi:hypothetical protein